MVKSGIEEGRGFSYLDLKCLKTDAITGSKERHVTALEGVKQSGNSSTNPSGNLITQRKTSLDTGWTWLTDSIPISIFTIYIITFKRKYKNSLLINSISKSIHLIIYNKIIKFQSNHH